MKKAYLHTFGCKVNQYETQLIREQLRIQGYDLTTRSEEADLVIVNSCSVTAEAERQCRQLLRKTARVNPRAEIIATGCYAVRSQQELSNLAPSIKVMADKNKFIHDAKAITSFNEHSRAFVKIQDGCDAFCSYCIVPYVRPVLWSKPHDEIVKEVQQLITSGYPEIVLTGIRLGKYDGGLSALLKDLISLEGDFRIRLSSLELLEVTPELLTLMSANPGKLCSHLHIPLQSGSDTVLRRMNRPYTQKKFAEIIASVKSHLPDCGITTDVIIGFPGESDSEFNETYDFLQKQSLSKLHVFTYSPRPGTKAALSREHVPVHIVKQRYKMLQELDRELGEKFWRSFIGSTRTVVREGKKGTALTDNYIRLRVNSTSHSNFNGILNMTIKEHEGAPMGEPKANKELWKAP